VESHVIAAPHRSLLRPKYLLFATIAMMMLVVLYKDLPLLHPSSATVERYRSFRWWLLPHAIAGTFALLLGPLQFSSRFRARHLGWHKVAGRFYVYGVAVAAPSGVYVEYLKFVNGIGSLRLVIATAGFAALFLLTTGMGFIRVRERKIEEHRRWMTRSYAVALIFLETRCVDQIPWLAKGFDYPSRFVESHSISDIWLFVLFAPIAAQLVLYCERVMKRKAARAQAGAACAR
jgi:uncharacterized membrane protein